MTAYSYCYSSAMVASEYEKCVPCVALGGETNFMANCESKLGTAST